ncbi:MAG: hypothetical protein AAFR58_05510 [Cyanobacteria bacterium J06627_28]
MVNHNWFNPELLRALLRWRLWTLTGIMDAAENDGHRSAVLASLLED